MAPRLLTWLLAGTSIVLLTACSGDGNSREDAAICREFQRLYDELNRSPSSLDSDRLEDELDNLSDRLRDASSGATADAATIAQLLDEVETLGSQGGGMDSAELSRAQESVSSLAEEYGCEVD